MSLRPAEIFCEVALHRSFSRAATAQGVSQSYVSQAVGNLEKHLGVALIDRSQRPLRLTPPGQLYFERCQTLLEEFQQLEADVRGLQDRVVGKLRVAAIYSVGLLEMGDCLRGYQEQYPDVCLRLDYRRPDEVYAGLDAEEYHLGLVSFPKASGDLRTIPWIEQPIVLAAPPDHPLVTIADEGSRFGCRVADLKDQVFVGFDSELMIRRRTDAWLREAGVRVRIESEFDNVENVKEAVRLGVGLALLPNVTIRHEAARGAIIPIPLLDATWTRPIGIVHSGSRPPSIAAEKFIELLHAEATRFREPEPEFSPTDAPRERTPESNVSRSGVSSPSAELEPADR